MLEKELETPESSDQANAQTTIASRILMTAVRAVCGRRR